MTFNLDAFLNDQVGWCRYCKRYVRVAKNKRLVNHGDLYSMCSGSGQAVKKVILRREEWGIKPVKQEKAKNEKRDKQAKTQLQKGARRIAPRLRERVSR